MLLLRVDVNLMAHSQSVENRDYNFLIICNNNAQNNPKTKSECPIADFCGVHSPNIRVTPLYLNLSSDRKHHKISLYITLYVATNTIFCYSLAQEKVAMQLILGTLTEMRLQRTHIIIQWDQSKASFNMESGA